MSEFFVPDLDPTCDIFLTGGDAPQSGRLKAGWQQKEQLQNIKYSTISSCGLIIIHIYIQPCNVVTADMTTVTDCKGHRFEPFCVQRN